MNVFRAPSTVKRKTFRAKPISSFEWHSYRTVRVEISVGRNYHEGARLEATLDWARKNFDHVVLLLGDTLQRYNLMMDGLSAEKAYSQSRIDGDAWLERNAHLLQNLTILRWDEVTGHTNFADARLKVTSLYDTNDLVQREIRKAIEEVAERREIDQDQTALFNRLSENYLLEEIAGAAIANTLYPGVSAYPGALPGLWDVVNDIAPSTLPQGLSDARSIELKLYKK
jgi:tRNA-dependent cyclodipeptide synthase